jgi:hypothetical protein
MPVAIRIENVHTDQIRQLGTFDFVQLTYNYLRVGPDGDEIMTFDGDLGVWYSLSGDDTEWTDIIIATPDSEV